MKSLPKNIGFISHKRMYKTTTFLSLILLVNVVSGCEQPKREAAPVQVAVRETAPLQAGMSISNRPSSQIKKASASLVHDSSKSSPNEVTLLPTEQAINEKSANKITINKKGVVSNKVSSGTPEETLKLAIDAQYLGNAEEAAKYYHTDVPNLVDELKKNQANIQKTIEKFTIVNTQYNKDKTQALIECQIKVKGESVLQKSVFRMKKINDKWKILV